MLKKDKITIYKCLFYIIVVSGILISAYKDYQTWLNPLGLSVEENPKQHDGSQEFTPPRDFESAIQPAPDDDGVRRYLDPYELHHHGKEPESKELSPDEAEEILVVPELGIDN